MARPEASRVSVLSQGALLPEDRVDSAQQQQNAMDEDQQISECCSDLCFLHPDLVMGTMSAVLWYVDIRSDVRHCFG